MTFFDFIDLFSNLATIGDSGSKRKRPKIYILFYILFIPAILWFAGELHSIWDLTSPVLFIVIFIGLGGLLTVMTVVGIYKLGLIEALTTNDFFTILFPVVLLTISCASFLNRTYGIMFHS